jgi:hypothetical protein
VRNAEVIERAIAAVARSTDGGLIVTPSAAASIHRDLVIGLAAKHKLPAVYASRSNVIDGGLISYGPDWVDAFRLAAGYVDCILKGEKPDDLPVQAPTKYETVINLKTAKALGLAVPSQVETSPSTRIVWLPTCVTSSDIKQVRHVARASSARRAGTRTKRVMPICNTQNEFAIVWILNLMWPLCPSTKATDKVGWRDVLAASTATYRDMQHRFNRDE